MINLSRVVNRARLGAKPFTVTRTTGAFGLGGFLTTLVDLPFFGIIQPASDEDLQQVPEGDRVTGMMSFISQAEMYKTRSASEGSAAGLSDVILWRCHPYRQP
jgi:hypothetical protein